jgi:hypothetical protein
MQKGKKRTEADFLHEIEILRRTIKTMMHLADLITFVGGPKEVCDLIKQHGQRGLDATKRYEEDSK